MNSNKFEYSYSAKQQEEIKKIREKYVPNTEDKIEKLWCSREHEGTVVTSHDLDRLVFFSKEAASNALTEIIKQSRGEVNGETL